MKKTVKLLSVLLAIIILGSVFVGCNSSNSTKKGNVTLTYSFYGDKTEIAIKQSMIKNYEKLNPNVKIKPTYTDGGTYPTKLQTYFASGTAPDVIALAADMYTDFAKKNLFLDLTSYIKSNGLQNKLAKQATNAFTLNNKSYAIGYGYKTYAIVYNKKLFDEAGIPYPKSDWSEEQFISYAKKLTKGEGTNKIYGMNFGWEGTEMMVNFYNNKPAYDAVNNKINIKDNDVFKHTLTLLSDSISKYKISPSATESKNIGGGFETGKFAMAIVGPWDIDGFEKLIGTKFNWDIVGMPKSADYGNWNCGLRVDGIAVSQNSKYKEQALDFAKWLCTDENNSKIFSQTSVPTLNSYAKSEEYLKGYPKEFPVKYNKQIFIDMQNHCRPIYWTGVWGKVNDQISKQYETFLLGKISLEEAINNMQINCDKLLLNN
ncbi:MAG TPA: sugar ABC transporter substrate-binding protein [Ruminiclostridium sp.]